MCERPRPQTPDRLAAPQPQRKTPSRKIPPSTGNAPSPPAQSSHSGVRVPGTGGRPPKREARHCPDEGPSPEAVRAQPGDEHQAQPRSTGQPQPPRGSQGQAPRRLRAQRRGRFEAQPRPRQVLADPRGRRQAQARSTGQAPTPKKPPRAKPPGRSGRSPQAPPGAAPAEAGSSAARPRQVRADPRPRMFERIPEVGARLVRAAWAGAGVRGAGGFRGRGLPAGAKGRGPWGGDG